MWPTYMMARDLANTVFSEGSEAVILGAAA